MNWIDSLGSVWSVFEHILVVAMGFYPVALHIWGRQIKKNADKLRNSSKLRHFLGVRGKSQYIFVKSDVALKMLKVVVTLTLMVCSAMAVDNLFPSYFPAIFNQKSELIGVILGLTGISMTVSAILATFDKKYYLCFSIRDVLGVSGYNEHLLLAGMSCVTFSLVAFATPDKLGDGQWGALFEYVLYISGVINILAVARTMWLVFKIVFLGRRIELKLLEQLHRLFDFRRLDVSNMKGKEHWDMIGAVVCVEHLADKYIDCCNRLRLGSIKQFEYVTTCELHRNRWSKKARLYAVLICLTWVVISLFAVRSRLSYTQEQLAFLGMIEVLVTTFVLTLDDEWTQRTLIDFYLGEWGYYIVENEGKEYYCSLGLFTLKGKYQKLVDRGNDIAAWFFIQKEVDMSRDIMINGFNTLCGQMKIQSIENVVYYLPAFSVGYILYIEEEKNEELLALKDIYKNLRLNEKDYFFFSQMMYGQIYNLIKYKFDETDKFNELFAEYERWLRTE